VNNNGLGPNGLPVNENDKVGVVDPTFLASLTDANGNSCLDANNNSISGTLYNFLSTFSGTHYVTPRTVTAQLGFNF